MLNFGLFCREFTHFLVYFYRWCTKIDKYQIWRRRSMMSMRRRMRRRLLMMTAWSCKRQFWGSWTPWDAGPYYAPCRRVPGSHLSIIIIIVVIIIASSLFSSSFSSSSSWFWWLMAKMCQVLELPRTDFTTMGRWLSGTSTWWQRQNKIKPGH